MSVAWYVRSRAPRLGLVASILGLSLLAGASATSAADTVTLTTPFPAVAVAPGANPSFDISVTTDKPDRVNLEVSGVPDGWTAVLRGGGFTIDGVETDGTTTPTKVTLNVTVPANATGTTAISGQGHDLGSRLGHADGRHPGDPERRRRRHADDRHAAAQGRLERVVLVLPDAHQRHPDDLPFSVVASGPDGWTVTGQIGSQSQAASVVVKAGSTSPVTVTAKAPDGAAAGAYPITVDATSGSRSAHADLSVEITGSYSLTLSTTDQRLNLNAPRRAARPT